MNKAMKIAIVVALVAVVGAVLAMKANQAKSTGTTATDAPGGQGAAQQSQPLPRLVDLGAGKCIPCKMMAPILEQLRHEYDGKLQVDVYDVWEDPHYAKQYGVRVIPTQVFYDAAGQELWRHEGFMAKEDILAKWKELGVNLSPKAVDKNAEE